LGKFSERKIPKTFCSSSLYLGLRKRGQALLREKATKFDCFFSFLQGILGYDRYINAVGDAEYNLVLMDYREDNNGKMFNRAKTVMV